MKKNILENKKGFTVIELLVASAIFVIFLAVAVGSFTRILQVQRTLARRIVITSALGTAIETISREVRVGYDFPIVQHNQPMGSLAFKSFATHDIENPVDVTYSFDGDKIVRTAAQSTQITPTDVVIKNATFIVNQKDKCQPWRITIVISAVPKGVGMDKPEEAINVQTTVTSRILPIDMKGDPYQCKSM
ncbi:MAG: Uncharacterized protein LiPW41_17 [Parcubacteria group bacterium LiPW_41]|nr:MAG: Uncharacterized protein LiPW41_17 [Parcubacteria group bacterium LiPW_41]